MTATATFVETPVLLFDIPWSTYTGILEALPEHRFRHTYDRGTFEIYSPLVYNVSWESYEQILAAFGDRHFRHTYSDGTLEIMSPSESHEWFKEFVGRLIEMAAFQLRMPIKCVGSTTLRHPKLIQGLEPDLAYYVQREPKVRGRHSLVGMKKPPPDLAIEIEITRKLLDRLEAYATLGVPEVWRFRDGVITFFVLKTKQYREVKSSLAFPALKSRDINRFLARLDDEDEQSILESFVEWLREGQTP